MRQLPVTVLVALVIVLLVKTFLAQVFVIPSGSMEETVRIGDRVVVDKLTPWFGYEPARGDIVVFKDPGGWLEAGHRPSTDGPVLRAAERGFSYVGLLPSENEQDLIKRVIGLPGDTVVCCDASGRVSVNGTAVDEPYIAPGNAPSGQPFRVRVPAGRLWVMGDHRDISADSRYHMAGPGGGTVPIGDVVGRAVVIAWPPARFQELHRPVSLSSVASVSSRALAASPQTAAGHPVPAEPPLVMGVLGLLPLCTRRGLPGSIGRSAVWEQGHTGAGVIEKC